VLTSLFELESMTTLEAMACGCPILIADSKHSAAKFFVDGNGYLFDPEDPKDLAQKLFTLISNPDLLETMRKKSIQNVAAFSFEKSVEKLETFFASFRHKE
jgi:1,2-diacylglycerol 3-alpha-glucosyltransferase